MPVKAWIGLQRQGKSYSAMKYAVLPALKKGREVVTNIALKQKAIDEFPNLIYQPEIDYKNLVAGALYVIDEVWKDCPKGVTAAKTPEEFKQFFAMSGHLVGENNLTTEIIVITQNLETQLCDYILGQIESTYYVEKKALTDGVKKCATTEYRGVVKGNPPRGKKEGTKLEAYDPEVFEYYKSNSGAEEGQTAIEMDAIKKKTLLDYPMVKYGLFGSFILLPILLYMAYSSLQGLFGGNTNEETKPDQQNQQIQQNITNKQYVQDQLHNISDTKIAKIDKVREKYDYFDELDAFPLSKDMRITGVYNYRFKDFKKQGVQVTIKNQKTLDIPMHNVRIDGYGEYFVVYRNQIITETTGQPPKEDYAYLPNGDAVPEDTTQQYFDMNKQLRGGE